MREKQTYPRNTESPHCKFRPRKSLDFEGQIMRLKKLHNTDNKPPATDIKLFEPPDNKLEE